MKIKVQNTELNLNDDICKAFKEKILYEITEKECEVYAQTYFNQSFDEIKKMYPVDSIEKAIENAMQEEIALQIGCEFMQSILGYGFLLYAPENYPESEYQEIKSNNNQK